MSLSWIYTCSKCGYKAEDRKALDIHFLEEH